MIRRPPRSTQSRSSAASDVYKRQRDDFRKPFRTVCTNIIGSGGEADTCASHTDTLYSVSYTHLRAHETVLDLVCRLLLEKKKESSKNNTPTKQRIKK